MHVTGGGRTYLAEAVEQSLEEQGDDDDDGAYGGDDPRGRVLQRYLLRAVGFGAAAGHGRRSPTSSAAGRSLADFDHTCATVPAVLLKLIPSP